MTEKLSISVTNEHAKLISDAVASGDYASTSEVIREALRHWKANRLLGQLWDEGLASGKATRDESIDAIKADARRSN